MEVHSFLCKEENSVCILANQIVNNKLIGLKLELGSDTIAPL